MIESITIPVVIVLVLLSWLLIARFGLKAWMAFIVLITGAALALNPSGRAMIMALFTAITDLIGMFS